MNKLNYTRRDVLKALSAGATVTTLSACASLESKATLGRVVVVGAGYGGLTAAKYLRLWSEGAIEVTLVDPNESFISCPISNLIFWIGLYPDAFLSFMHPSVEHLLDRLKAGSPEVALTGQLIEVIK